MSLSEKIAKAVADIVAEHEADVSAEEVVGSMLTVATTYGKKHISKEELLDELGIQMVILSRGEEELLSKVLRQVNYRAVMFSLETNTALIQSALRKAGGGNRGTS